MKTQTISSLFALSAPLADTPILPSYDPSLMASYKIGGVTAASGGKVSKWANSLGVWGTAGDLTPFDSATPPTVGTIGVVFPGVEALSYMNAPSLATPMPLSAATFLARLKFNTRADEVDCSVFSSTDSAKYAFLRRKANGTLEAGVNTGARMFTTQAIPVNVWVDVALVVNGADSYIYINDSGTKGDPRLDGVSGTFGGLRLGANIAGITRLIGEMSHFQVYNRAIGLDELKQIRSEM